MEWLDKLKGFFKDDDGLDWSKILGTGVGAAGLVSLLRNDQVKQFLGLGGANTNQPVGYQGGIPDYTAQRTQLPTNPDPNRRPGSGGQRYFSDVTYAPVAAAQGGLMSLPSPQGYYLGGVTDGMADKIPARIDGKQEARLSDGEFVIPADVVGHLGNGNSQPVEQVRSLIGQRSATYG